MEFYTGKHTNMHEGCPIKKCEVSLPIKYSIKGKNGFQIGKCLFKSFEFDGL